MKKIIILISLFLLVFTVFSEAQTTEAFKNHTKFKHSKYGKHKAIKQLNLTDQQKQQAKSIHEKYRQQLATLEGNNSISLGEFKKQFASLKAQQKSDLENLLTPEQKQEVATMKKNRADNAQVRSVARLEKMKLKLNLTDEQVAKIKTQQAGLKEKLQSIKKNERLLPNEKREQLKVVMLEEKKNMESVLTKEQQDKMQEYIKNLKNKRNTWKQQQEAK